MKELSVSIISFNEEANIARCIESVKDIASEIIVVDSHSTDRTVEIAKSCGAQVFIEDWKGFVGQKNSAFDKCSMEWILNLDCDEEVSPELKKSIKEATSSTEYDGYMINRKTIFMGRWIEHAWYPDWNLRLIRKGKGRWEGQDIHEKLEVKGTTGRIAGNLLHYTYKDFMDMLIRTVRYASLGAESYIRANKKVHLANLVFNPFYGFIKHYFLKLGFLDGAQGFIISVMNFVYTFYKYAIIWEKQNKKK